MPVEYLVRSTFTMDSVVGDSEVAAPIVGGGASLVSSLQALSIVDATALPRLIPFEVFRTLGQVQAHGGSCGENYE